MVSTGGCQLYWWHRSPPRSFPVISSMHQRSPFLAMLLALLIVVWLRPRMLNRLILRARRCRGTCKHCSAIIVWIATTVAM